MTPPVPKASSPRQSPKRKTWWWCLSEAKSVGALKEGADSRRSRPRMPDEDQARSSVPVGTVGSPAGHESGGHNVRRGPVCGLCLVFGAVFGSSLHWPPSYDAHLCECALENVFSLTCWCLEFGVVFGVWGAWTGAASSAHTAWGGTSRYHPTKNI